MFNTYLISEDSGEKVLQVKKHRLAVGAHSMLNRDLDTQREGILTWMAVAYLGNTSNRLNEYLIIGGYFHRRVLPNVWIG